MFSLDIQTSAHLVIDPQANFYGAKPHGIRAVSAIADFMTSSRIPHILVYMDLLKEGPEVSCGGIPEEVLNLADITLRKSLSDSFEFTELGNILKNMGTKTLIVSGFNLDACVKDTIRSARAYGFDVYTHDQGIGSRYHQDETVPGALKHLKQQFGLRGYHH